MESTLMQWVRLFPESRCLNSFSSTNPPDNLRANNLNLVPVSCPPKNELTPSHVGGKGSATLCRAPRGCSSMVEPQPSKLAMPVRSRSPAPRFIFKYKRWNAAKSMLEKGSLLLLRIFSIVFFLWEDQGAGIIGGCCGIPPRTFSRNQSSTHPTLGHPSTYNRRNISDRLRKLDRNPS